MKKSHKMIRNLFLIIAIAFFELSFNKVFAADLSISANKSTIGNGETATITVSSQYTGRVNLTVSGGTLSNSKVWLEKGSGTVTVTANSDNGVKITATPDEMSDSSGNTVNVGAKSVSIAKKTTNTNPKPNTNTTNNTNNTNNTKSTEKEPIFKSANETVYATGNINVRKSYSADSDKMGSLQQGEKVTRTGVGDNGWSKISYNGGVGYIKSSLLTAEEPKKSEDKSLKSLTIDGYEIDPAFDPEITDYSIAIDKDVEKLDIKAEPSSDKAKVEISGNDALSTGDNLIKITVTAEDQTTRIYTVAATKQSEEAVALSSLKVDGYTLNPKFSPDVLEYKITVLDPNISSLNITALTNIENAKVETTGNTNLKDGENIILVKITSEDGVETATYKITVTKNATAAGTTDSNNWILYAGIGVIVILVILIVVVIVISKRNAQYEDYDEDEEDDDNDAYSDLYGYSSSDATKVTNRSEHSIDNQNKNTESEKYQAESLYDNNNVNTNNIQTEERAPKYEDGFKYNAYNSKNIYGNYKEETENNMSNSYSETSSAMDIFNSKMDNSTGYNGDKDVNYYNNKFSEIFDNKDGFDKVEQGNFEDLSTNTNVTKSDNDYSYDENNGNYDDDDYKPRRTRGKHAK